MTDLVTNEYGVDFESIPITRLRIHRTDGKWLIEYQREPRWFLGLDRWWWFNDGTYIEYNDALERLDYLKTVKYVNVVKFQSLKTIDID